MKYALSILLISIFLLPTVSKAWIIIDFKINQDYIARVLCINKEKPKSSCNGKCHLKKQLKKAEEKEQKQAPALLKQKTDLVFITTSLLNYKKCIGRDTNAFKNNTNTSLICLLFTNSLFRPPEFI